MTMPGRLLVARSTVIASVSISLPHLRCSATTLRVLDGHRADAASDAGLLVGVVNAPPPFLFTAWNTPITRPSCPGHG